MNRTGDAPRWMFLTLRLAGAYNAAGGVALALFPAAIFNWLRMPATPDVMVRCIGMLVGVYGLAYWVAAADPVRYWPLVAVGLVGKTLGPIGFFMSVQSGALVLKSGTMVVFNDLIWWLPFWAILLHVWKNERARYSVAEVP